MTSGRPTCRLAPEGRWPPRCGFRSGAPSLAIGVGSSRIAMASGAPGPLPSGPGLSCQSRRASQDAPGSPLLRHPADGAGSGLAGEDEYPVAAVAGAVSEARRLAHCVS